jgi:hypothetical protein
MPNRCYIGLLSLIFSDVMPCSPVEVQQCFRCKWDSKVCDSSILIQLLTFCTLIIILFFMWNNIIQTGPCLHLLNKWSVNQTRNHKPWRWRNYWCIPWSPLWEHSVQSRCYISNSVKLIFRILTQKHGNSTMRFHVSDFSAACIISTVCYGTCVNGCFRKFLNKFLHKTFLII